MSQAITVDSISKRFRINHAAEADGRTRPLREAIGNALLAPLRNLRTGAALGNVEDFWALRDISFDVETGEAVGIIGSNGAGKSTLLKILTRITEPTSGRAVLRGRVGSLLEVGTGFHPELSGRENVFLNGAILGMGRREIKSKFDEIVDFSGVEQFIDTPIKRYSSGMKVRLAFAVAAHLDLEVMIIDEVLAVGDIEFQRKCLGKMEDVTGHGRTVLFVSHNMNAITQLCTRAVLLEHGQLVADGKVSEVTHEYLKRHTSKWGSTTIEACLKQRLGGKPFITGITVNNVSMPRESIVAFGEAIDVTISGDAGDAALRNFRASVHINSEDGIRLVSIQTLFSQARALDVEGIVDVKCHIPMIPLIPGTYLIDVSWLADGGFSEFFERVGAIRVNADENIVRGRLIPTYKSNGYFYFDANWSVVRD